MDKERIDLAEAAYAEGLTLDEVGSAVDADRRTLGKHFKQRGVNTMKHGLSEMQVDEAVNLYQDGLSLVRVRKHFGVYPESIRYRLLLRGVELRPRPGWQQTTSSS